MHRSIYGGDEANRLKQEVVLGVGGLRMLHALGFEIRQYHLNEGHSPLLALELLRWFVRRRCTRSSKRPCSRCIGPVSMRGRR